jgi:hypothetical protein
MIKPLLATLASATFTVLLAPPLHAADADVMRESADRAAIDALMWKYVRALDGYDPEGYASLYTSDGQFGSGTQAAKGHEALQKMIVGFKERHEAQKAKGEPTPVMHQHSISQLSRRRSMAIHGSSGTIRTHLTRTD